MTQRSLEFWYENSIHSTKAPDIVRAKDAVARIYRDMALECPEIVWCEGPAELIREGKIQDQSGRLREPDAFEKEFAWHFTGRQPDSNPTLCYSAPPNPNYELLCFQALALSKFNIWDLKAAYPYLFFSWEYWLTVSFISVDGLEKWVGPETTDYLKAWMDLSFESCAGMFSEKRCYLSQKPCKLLLNERRQLHCEDAPALEFRDGTKIYSMRGIQLNPNIFEEADYITEERIIAESNSEVREILLSKYGLERYLEKGGRLIHKDEFGELYEKAIGGDEPLMMVKVKNASPEPDGSVKYYLLRVPPQMLTAKQAVAWTFGFENSEMDDYGPRIES